MDTGTGKLKERILKYLKKRREGIIEIMKETFKEEGEVKSSELEVFLTYSAIISDIKHERLD